MGRKQKTTVREEFKISLNLVLKKFRQEEGQKELAFPSSFTSSERAYIHRYCQKLGLKSKSRGEGANRYLTVYKKEGSTIVQADAIFELGRCSRQHVFNLLQRFPVSARERQDLLPPVERDRFLLQNSNSAMYDINRITGRLSNGIPMVPPYRTGELFLLEFRQSLPIWHMKDEIVHNIHCHQVVLISGETGSGKTTQVPQFLLDNACLMGQPCRIICTQPRRIAALSVAERVATERGEKVGQTVGYQIRLESRVSPKTLLTFCTHGVLLRTLMGGDANIATVTHIIVDELHERDRFSDFLLTILRDLLLKFRSLKLILMSAVLDMQLFVKYFSGCPVIEVPGRLFDVKAYYLEDILKSTGYATKAMIKYLNSIDKKNEKRHYLDSWCSSLMVNSSDASSVPKESDLSNQAAKMEDYGRSIFFEEDLASKVDKVLHDAWLTGDEDSFCTLLQFILSENVSVDYQHSEASVSPLMVAAGRGNINAVEQLLALGANTQIRSSNDWTALDFAKNFGHKEVQELLEAHWQNDSQKSEIHVNDCEITTECKLLLEAYQHCTDDEKVDLDLILCLLQHICSSQVEGSVLVFLPGYDEIVTLKDRIRSDEKNFLNSNRFFLYTLHSQMQSSDQKRVFKPVPLGYRKIILSTNIAESSITINDVVFVIDSGKIKEKSYDALHGVTQLKTGWVSQASAIQRRGRAGRSCPGVCYHLFSRLRFNSLQKFQVPEILRVPIHELCLQAKLLAPPNLPIADFLAKAPDPPPFMVTRNAVTLLKTIDALDPWEELTELGLHLLDIPIEPRLGKMILYSIVLKCLDPILTIVCFMAYRDPFLLPSQPSQKKVALSIKKKFACGTYSDHLALLRAFQTWQNARADGHESSFCHQNFISTATMEMVVGMKNHLLGQLRASGFIKSRGGGDIKDLNCNSDIWPVIKAALCAGTYPNLIRIDRERQQLLTQKESKVRFHHNCVLNDIPVNGKQTLAALHGKIVSELPSDWLIYEELTRNGHIAHAHCCTLISPITIALFCGPARLPLDAVHEPDRSRLVGCGDDSDSEEETQSNNGQKAVFKIDDWISFKIDPEAARLAHQLRQKWHALFLRRMHAPSKLWSQVDEAVVRSIVNVLVAEEQSLGLKLPQGIGQKSHFINSGFSLSMNSGSQLPSTSFQGVTTSSNYNPCNMVGMQNRFSALSVENSAKSQPEMIKKVLPSTYNNTMHIGTRRISSDKHKDELSGYPPPHTFSNCSRNIPETLCTNSQIAAYQQRKQNLDCHHASQQLPAKIRFFVIKAHNPKMLELSAHTNIWAFTRMTEQKLLSAAKEGSDVILIFSLQGSGHFQGLAHFTCHIADQRPPEFNAPNIGTCYRIEWIKRGNIPFQSTRHLLNSWNENRKVQISRDGQELEPSVGESLCKLWDKFNFPTTTAAAVLGNKFDSYNNPVTSDRVLTHSPQVSCPAWYKSLPTAAPLLWSQPKT